MIEAGIPKDEKERLADLRALNLLDTPPEERFDRIVHLAASVFGVSIAYIALIDEKRQWFKAKCGLATDETGRDVSFCGHAIIHEGPLIVPDATLDDRFADNPLVVGEPYVRFYAGYPLKGPHGYNVGTFCIADSAPREINEDELRQFGQLAAIAEHELGMLDLIESQQVLLDMKNRLVETQARLDEELSEAAVYVRSLLPKPLAGSIRTDWEFVSSSRLGGDLFGYHWIDGNNLGLYLLDVCGHGVSAALLSISIFNDLRRQSLPDTDFHDPSAVLAMLNRTFPMEQHGQKFTTVWYGVYELTSRNLRFASAGHPPALLRQRNGELIRLGKPNLPIGVETDTIYEGGNQTVDSAALLYIFSDGVFELPDANGQWLMIDGFADIVATCCNDGTARTECVRRRVQALSGSSDFADDFSLLEVEFR